jgi:Flp pilus assembly protein TadD
VTAARLVSVVVAAACLALGGYLALAQRSESRLEQAADAVAAGMPDSALHELGGLTGQAGGRAAAVRAQAHVARGDLAAAHRELRRALRRDPNVWLLHRDDAVVLLALGRRAAARRAMRRARALNPRIELPPGFAAAAP